MNEKKRLILVEFPSKRRETIDVGLSLKTSSQCTRLRTMSWRVDVSISTSSLSRTLEPFVIIELVLSDGRVISFESPVNMFHLLRFNVALVLKEINDLLSKQFFKLSD